MKRTLVGRILILIVLLFMVGVGTGYAYVYEFAGGSLELQGHITSTIAVRTEDHEVMRTDRVGKELREKWDLGMWRNEFQLEWNLDLGTHFSLVGIFRSAYEASYDVQSVARRYNAVKTRDVDRWDDSLRELYGVFTFDEWTIKLGKQQLIWGETDILRMADIINPLDYSWDYFNPSWEEIRRPLRMAVVTYAPKALIHRNFSIEAVYIPEDFKPNYWPQPGANWHFDMGGYDFLRYCYRASEPSSGNDEYGVRVRGVLPCGVEVSVFDFYARTDGFVIDQSHYINFLTGANPSVKFCDFKKYNVSGVTANWFDPWTNTVWRFESAYFFKQPMNDEDYKDIKRDSINWMFGFDRPTWIRFLNPTTTFFVSFQWFHRELLDWNNGNGLVSADMSNDKRQDVFIGLIQGQYLNYTLSPTISVAYDPSGWWYLAPNVLWKASDKWNFKVGAVLSGASNNRQGFVGPTEKNDYIFFQIRYGFK